MDLSKVSKINRKVKYPKLTGINKGFVTIKLESLYDLTFQHLKSIGRATNNEEINNLTKEQMISCIDIYFRDLAAYLHTPTSTYFGLPLGVFKIRFGSIDSYLIRKVIPNLRLAKINNTDPTKLVNVFNLLWKLRNVKRIKRKSPIKLDNKSLQLASSYSYNINAKETNPTKLILIQAINKLIKNDSNRKS